MRGIICRDSRLVLVAGLVMALAVSALAAPVSGSVSTTTTLTAGTLNGCVQPLTVNVTAGGTPVTSGTVTINDEFNGNAVQLASVALSSSGSASPSVDLADGSHSLTASFTGITGYQASTSTPAVLVSVATECEFSIAIPTSSFIPASTTNTLTLIAGQSGSLTITVTPSVEFTSTLTAPMFVTLSCSGLPDGAACSATPENLEILSTTPESCPSGSPASSCPPTSNMVILTYAASNSASAPATPQGNRPSPIAWAFLLPGALGLGGLAFGARRRRWLSRLSLLALVGLVTMLGATACNPRYNYLNHGPPTNPATPSGTYTVTVTAQSSNGVTALTHSTTFTLIVN
ncbi:MAG: Ig-like domain repeat protein [Terracidiphilus sp.]